MVTGRSVFSRSVKQGTPRNVVSSCTPPESVSTPVAWASSTRKSTYPVGSIRCSPGDRSTAPEAGTWSGDAPETLRGKLTSNACQLGEDAAKESAVDERRAVESNEQVIAMTYSNTGMNRRGGDARPHLGEGVDHRIADENDPRRVNALSGEIGRGFGTVDQTPPGDLIDEHSVDLLGIGPIEAAQTCLKVCNIELELHGGERAGQSGVDITGHNYEARLKFEQDLLDALQRPRRLGSVVTRAHTEKMVRFRHPQVVEEDRGHFSVVMLPSVQHDVVYVRKATPHLRDDGRHLDEVRPCANHVDDGTARTCPKRQIDGSGNTCHGPGAPGVVRLDIHRTSVGNRPATVTDRWDGICRNALGGLPIEQGKVEAARINGGVGAIGRKRS